MSMHSITEAKKRLSELIDRALKGERMVLTRHGRPVVELRPVAPTVRQLTREDVDWLAVRRVGAVRPQANAGALVSGMRDDGEC